MENLPVKRRRLVKWLAIFSLWTFFGLFFTSMLVLQYQLAERPVSLWRILSWQLVSGYIWFAISPLILLLAKRFPFDDGKWKTSLPVHVIACIIIPPIQLAVDAFVLTRLGYPPGKVFADFFDAYKWFLVVNIHMSMRSADSGSLWMSSDIAFSVLKRKWG